MTGRVAITGIGAITPIGCGAEGLWQGVRRGESAVRRITRFDPAPFRSQVAAEVNFDPLSYFDGRQMRRLDRPAQFAVASARMALEDAGLTAAEVAASGAGIASGSALGGVAFGEEQHAQYVASGPRGVNPRLALNVYGGAAGAQVSIALGLTGPSPAFANSCTAGLMAIGEAARLIAAGRAEIMLAGGIEAPLAPLTFGAFSLINVLSTRNDDPATASRPFDAARDGFVLAEGAAILVLETPERARARGARIYAEILGYATTNDAYHMTAPRPDGTQAGRAMSEALADAGLPPDAIDYVNAHGSSTVLNDPTECRAIRLAFGAHADRVAVSGTKGLHGHALAASGAIETAICAMALAHNRLPGTANLHTKDPACDLDIVRMPGREAEIPYLLTNSFGFGGVNASLVMAQH